MAWNPTLTKLRNLLADRYITPQDARRVIVEAGLDPAHIAFDSKAVNNWHNILTQADLRGKVPAIVEIAMSEFGSEPEFLATCQEYLAASGQSAASADTTATTGSTTQQSGSTTTYNITLNNPQGTVIGDNAQVTQDTGSTQIDTGGGAYIGGNADTGGGDFVGRDKVNASNLADQLGNFDERAELEALLTQHKRNLLRLRQQKATYAIGEEPLRLLNQIDHEEQEIAKLEAQRG